MLVSSNYSVKTQVFEGPLELMLDLVEKHKLLINDISLTVITDDYMQYVGNATNISLLNKAQFIAVASTLLLAKSRSLLPVLKLTEEEEVSISDLEERLKKYQIIRDQALIIREQFGKNKMYTAQFLPPKEAIFVPDRFCELGELKEAMQRVLKKLPTAVKPTKAKVKTVISLEEMMQRLQTRIFQQAHFRFSELKRDNPEVKVVIVGFLAVLELFKQGNLIVTQDERFADIEVELDKSQTPVYY